MSSILHIALEGKTIQEHYVIIQLLVAIIVCLYG